MTTFATVKNAKILDINGLIFTDSARDTLAEQGAILPSGTELVFSEGSELTLLLDDGSVQRLYAQQQDENGEIEVASVLSDPQSAEVADLPNAELLPQNQQDEIAAIQASIDSSGDDTVVSPDTAAGGQTGNEGADFVLLERNADETLAEAGYDTVPLENPLDEIADPLTLEGTEQPTITQPDFNTIPEDTTATGNVLTNDSDADDVLTIQSYTVVGDPNVYLAGQTSPVSGGSLTINADGSYVFVPAVNFNGTLPVVTYTTNTNASDTLTITVTPVSDLTDADEIATTAEDTAVFGNVLDNAASADGTPQVQDFTIGGNTFVAGTTANVTEGALTVNSDGSYTFTPAENFNGNVPVVSYTVADGINTDVSTLTIDVTPVSDLADGDENVTTEEDTPVSGNVLDNAGSADGTPVVVDFTINGNTFAAGTTATITQGNLTVNTDGSFTFNPAENFNGAVPVVSYTVSDGINSDLSSLSINVTPVSDLTDEDEVVVTEEDTPVSGNLLDNAASTDGTPVVLDFTVAGSTFAAGQNASFAEGSLTVNSDGSYTFTPAENYNGDVPAVTYTVSDGINNDLSVLSINVTPVSDLVDDNEVVVTLENNPVAGNVLDNAASADGTPIVAGFEVGGVSYSAGDSAVLAEGTLTINGDGSYNFDPALGFDGAVPVATYTVSDGVNTDDSTLTITVTPVDLLPVAVNDAANTLLNTPVSGNVLANDSQGDGPASVTAFDAVSANGGTVTVGSNGLFTYSPANGFLGADTFTYTISDSDGDTSTATVTVNVLDGDLLPNAVNDVFNTDENIAVGGNVLGNDSLGDGPTTVTAFDATSVGGGTVVMNGSGTFLYTPLPGFTGPDTFTYSITDSDGDTSTATVTVNVNDLPLAVNDAVATTEDTPVSGSVLDNDDQGNAPAQVTPFTATTGNGGSVSMAANGVFTYTPASGYIGTDSFTYEITDTDGDKSSATVFVAVNENNDLQPLAANDTYNTDENNPVGGNVLTNDFIGDGPTTVTAYDSTSANGGTVVMNAAGVFTYQPGAGFTGTDTFTYTITDSDGDTSTATVTVNVNDLPVAVNDAFNTDEGTSVGGNVLTNDDLGNTPSTVTSFDATSANGGTVVMNAAGVFTYTPASNFTGTDTFTYTITDNDGDTSTATVTVNVNDLPDAQNDTFATDENVPVGGSVLGNDDLGNGPTTVTAFDAISANGGTVVMNPAGVFTYTPASGFKGADTFTYTITDSDGDTSTATVTVNVNDLPVAVDDAFDTDEGTPVGGNVLTNDDQGNAPALVTPFTTVTANGGTVTMAANGTFTYTPAAGFTGFDSFDYTITDTDGDTSDATVLIDVNNLPDAVDDSFTTPEDTPVGGNVLTNDDQGDAPALVTPFTTVTGNGGTVVMTAAGVFSYTPAAGFTGADTFTYTITDTDGDTSDATVTVNVTTANVPPVAEDDFFSVNEGASVSGNVITHHDGDLVVDSDGGDGGTLSVTQVNGTDLTFDAITGYATLRIQNGELKIKANGDFTYTNDEGFDAADAANPLETPKFTYTLSDGTDTDTADVTITVVISAPEPEPDFNYIRLVPSAGDPAIGEQTIVLGNVVTRGSSGDGLDSFPDGQNTPPLVNVNYNGTDYAFDASTPPQEIEVIQGGILYGHLTIEGSGDYQFETVEGLELPATPVLLTFDYTVRDADTLKPDEATETLTIEISTFSGRPKFAATDNDTDSGTIDTHSFLENLGTNDAGDKGESDLVANIGEVFTLEQTNSIEQYLFSEESNAVVTLDTKAIDQQLELVKADPNSEEYIANGLLAEGGRVVGDGAAVNQSNSHDLDTEVV